MSQRPVSHVRHVGVTVPDPGKEQVLREAVSGMRGAGSDAGCGTRTRGRVVPAGRARVRAAVIPLDRRPPLPRWHPPTQRPGR